MLSYPSGWSECADRFALAANHMASQMASMNPAAGINPFQPGQDPDKLYQSEAENLEVIEHFCILDGVEERVLAHYAGRKSY